MIPVLDSDGMRRADAETIQDLGVPSLVLMEMAAGAVTEVVTSRFPTSVRVAVVCGPGNNGGDGLAVARQLRCRGWKVEAVVLSRLASLRGDAAAQLALARSFGVPVSAIGGAELRPLEAAVARADVVVDALFGTGLDRPLEGPAAAAVGIVAACGRPVVAVDLPSGLSGASSAADWPAVTAEITVTFAAPKLAHVLPPACYRCGEVAVAEIGIPPWVIERQASVWLVEADDVAGWLPVRAPDAHKGHFGHLGVIAGRRGRAGAAVLTARAAVLAGAGLVTVAAPEGALTPIQSGVPEAMVDVISRGTGGPWLSEVVDAFLAKSTALAVGPGMGLGDAERKLLDTVLDAWRGPLVLDADALTLLAGRLSELRGRAAATVLTPHPGELARLLGCTIEAVTRDRLGAVRDAAAQSGAVVLVKGARTIVAEPSGRALVNPTGTAGLASGGAGDTLTGVIGALLAQGVDAPAAAAAAAFLHGRAAELAAERYPAAVPAGRLAGLVARAWTELAAGGDGP